MKSAFHLPLAPVTLCLLGAITPIVTAQTTDETTTKPTVAVGTTPSPTSPRVKQLVDKVITQLQGDGDIDAARSSLKKIIAAEPTSPLPYYNLAILAETEERWDEAIKWMGEYLKLDSVSPLSKRAQKENERLKAVRDADATPEGKKQRKYNEAVLTSRTLLQQGQLPEAVERAEEAVGLDGNRYEAYVVVAMALTRRSYFSDAAFRLQKAVERAPDARQIDLRNTWNKTMWEAKYQELMASGGQVFQKKDYATAASQLTLAWRYFPERDEAGLQAATSLIMCGSYTAAETILNRVSRSSNAKSAAQGSDLLEQLKTMRKDGDASNKLNEAARRTREAATKQLETATAEESSMVTAYNQSITDSESANENYRNAVDAYNAASGQTGNMAAAMISAVAQVRMNKYQQIYEQAKSAQSNYRSRLATARQNIEVAQDQLDQLGNTGMSTIVWDPAYDVSILTRSSLLNDIILPANTKVALQVDEDLVSGKAQVNQQVKVSVKNDVVSPEGAVVIPKGSAVKGHVALAKNSEPKKPAYEYIIDSVQAADNSLVVLKAIFSQKYPAGVNAKKPDSFLQTGASIEATVNTMMKIKKTEAPQPVATTSVKQ